MLNLYQHPLQAWPQRSDWQWPLKQVQGDDFGGKRDKGAMHSLPIFVKLEGSPVILIGRGEAAEAKARLLARAGARIVGEDSDARLAIVIDDDAAVVRLRARGILVNAVDRPELCDFTLPAIVERGAVLVAIGTGGVSAGLAAALRQRLELLLPAGLGRLAEALHAARNGLRARHPDSGARREAIAAMLAAGGPLDALAEHADPRPADVADAEPGARLERIALVSPDPDDLTLRAARLLGSADRLYHPADMPGAILDRARADAARIVGLAPALPGPGLSVEIGWSAP